MLTNDFVTMARAADQAPPSAYPNAWRFRNLTLAAIPLGLFRLLYLVAVLCLGWWGLCLSPSQMQTLTFTMLVFVGRETSAYFALPKKLDGINMDSVALSKGNCVSLDRNLRATA